MCYDIISYGIYIFTNYMFLEIKFILLVKWLEMTKPNTNIFCVVKIDFQPLIEFWVNCTDCINLLLVIYRFILLL